MTTINCLCAGVYQSIPNLNKNIEGTAIPTNGFIRPAPIKFTGSPLNRRNLFQRTGGRLIGVLAERFSSNFLPPRGHKNKSNKEYKPQYQEKEYQGVVFNNNPGNLIEQIQNGNVFFNVRFFIAQFRRKFIGLNGKHYYSYVEGLGSIDLRYFRRVTQRGLFVLTRRGEKYLDQACLLYAGFVLNQLDKYSLSKMDIVKGKNERNKFDYAQCLGCQPSDIKKIDEYYLDIIQKIKIPFFDTKEKKKMFTQ